jgi:hypothetical protein
MKQKPLNPLVAAALASIAFVIIVTTIEAIFNPSEVVIPFTPVARLLLYPSLAILVIVMFGEKQPWHIQVLLTAVPMVAMYVLADIVVLCPGDYLSAQLFPSGHSELLCFLQYSRFKRTS